MASPIAVGTRLGDRWTVTRVLSAHSAAVRDSDGEPGVAYFGPSDPTDEFEAACEVLEQVPGAVVPVDFGPVSVAGVDLYWIVEQDPRNETPASDAAFADGVAAVLAGVHSAGVVHGALSPSCVNADGSVSGFGLRLVGIAEDPKYRAPELWDRREPTPASDVYAFGCVIPALHGLELFGGPDVELSHRLGPIPDMKRIPEPDRSCLRRCLMKEPRSRPSAAAIFDDAQPLDTSTTVIDRPVSRVGWRRIASMAAIPLVFTAAMAQARQGAEVPVVLPDVVGRTVTEAREQLRATGFEVDARLVDAGGIGGRVVSQLPRGHRAFRKGSTVVLEIARGAEQVAVPDVTGLSAVWARDLIRLSGLEPVLVYTKTSKDLVVLETSPGPENLVDNGSKVSVVLGTGGGT